MQHDSPEHNKSMMCNGLNFEGKSDTLLIISKTTCSKGFNMVSLLMRWFLCTAVLSVVNSYCLEHKWKAKKKVYVEQEWRWLCPTWTHTVPLIKIVRVKYLNVNKWTYRYFFWSKHTMETGRKKTFRASAFNSRDSKRDKRPPVSDCL